MLCVVLLPERLVVVMAEEAPENSRKWHPGEEKLFSRLLSSS
jgi:hypothetical protein